MSRLSLSLFLSLFHAFFCKHKMKEKSGAQDWEYQGSELWRPILIFPQSALPATRKEDGDRQRRENIAGKKKRKKKETRANMTSDYSVTSQELLQLFWPVNKARSALEATCQCNFPPFFIRFLEKRWMLTVRAP